MDKVIKKEFYFSQQTKNDPVFTLYKNLKTRQRKMISNFDLWSKKIDDEQKVLAHTKFQAVKYTNQILQSSNYLKEGFISNLMEKFQCPTKVNVTIDGKKIKNIIKDKWSIINQCYFNNKRTEKNEVHFFHPRIGKLFGQILDSNIKQTKSYVLNKDALSQLIIQYRAKMLSKQFIAIHGLMLSGKYERYQQLINTSQISDNVQKIQITYETKLDVSAIKGIIEQKPFTNLNTQKLLKNVKDQVHYKNVSSQEFKDTIRNSQFQNSQFAFQVLGCILQLEYLNQCVKEKKIEPYFQNFAVNEGHSLAKGIIIGGLYELYNNSSENDQLFDQTLSEFIKFFGNLFTEKCDQINIVKRLCKGIIKYKSKNPALSTKNIIKQVWNKK